MHAAKCAVVVSALLVSMVLVRADDWPQWRGPERTGLSKEKGLLKSWPKDGPKLLWKITDAGEGFACPAIAGGFLYTMGNRGEDEMVLCYDLTTGKEKWAVKNGKAFKDGAGNGPRCTPTVDGNERVYALGGDGDLCCLNTKDGKERWRLNILKEFKGNRPGWGICESPLIEDNWLIVTPGGKDATIVALDKRDGKTIWKGKDPEGQESAGYASPIVYTVGNMRQVATFTSKGGIGVRADNGEFLWRNDKAANGTANITTPVFHDGRIFFTSDYGTGCVLLQLSPGGSAEEVYFNKDMKNHHGGVVLLGDYLYGCNGGTLTCMKFDDGKVMWQNRGVGKGSISYADGCLYVLSEDGVMGLIEATPSGYKELGRFKLPERSGASTWTHPVIANGRLYLRDMKFIWCYDIKGK